MSNRAEQSYLGDGVYVSYDGYHVRLAVNSHYNEVVALEPIVLGAVVRYAIKNSPEAKHYVEEALKEGV